MSRRRLRDADAVDVGDDRQRYGERGNDVARFSGRIVHVARQRLIRQPSTWGVYFSIQHSHSALLLRRPAPIDEERRAGDER